MHLTVYYYDKLLNQEIPVKDFSLPVINIFENQGYAVFLIRNTSSEVVNDIELVLDMTGITGTLKVAKLPAGLLPAPADFQLVTNSTLNITHPVLYPGEAISLFIDSVVETPLTIDITDIPLDITYRHGFFPSLNLIRHFEFTESLDFVENNIVGNSYPTIDSYNSHNATCTNGIANQHIIKGDGYARFLSADDIIEDARESGELYNNMTVFFKGIIPPFEGDNTLIQYRNTPLNTNNIDKIFGLDERRRLFISVVGDRVISTEAIEDVYGEHVFGFSISSNFKVILSVDGNILTPSVFQSPHIVVNNLPLITIGESATAYLSDVIIFNDFKLPSFHKYLSEKLK